MPFWIVGQALRLPSETAQSVASGALALQKKQETPHA